MFFELYLRGYKREEEKIMAYFPQRTCPNASWAKRIEYISTAIISTIFAISFARLEYFYTTDPALQISNVRGCRIGAHDIES